MAKTLIVIDSDDDSTKLSEFQAPVGDKMRAAGLLRRLVNRVHSVMSSVVEMAINAVSATGTLTFASSITGDTIVIAGVTLTADTDYTVGVSDTADAAAAVVAINADATISLYVVATSAAAVVTLTAIHPGALGNLVTTVTTGGTVTASGAVLASGANGTNGKHYYGSRTA